MTKRRAWLTPSANEGPTIVRPLFVPLAYLPMVAGALAELTETHNWEQSGNIPPQIAASAMAEMLYLWRDAGVGALSMFRLTEECAFEYSNDGGETWQAVPGWTEYAAACLTGPAGPQGETGPAGPAGPAGPQGETGIVGVQEVYVDGDTQPRLEYNPQTRMLTATMQEQWLRGIRITPADVPENLAGHAIELQTYDDPETWVRLGYIPPYTTASYVDPEPLPVPDEFIACGMATNLMAKLYANWEQSIQVLNTAEDVTEAVGEFIETFNVTLLPIPFSLIADGINTAFSITASVLESAFTPTNYDELLEALYCRFLAYGSFDGEVILDWWTWIMANYTPLSNAGVWWFGLQTSWTNLQFMKRHALIGSLDPLTTCQFFGCGGPIPLPCYHWDFTQDSGAWAPVTSVNGHHAGYFLDETTGYWYGLYNVGGGGNTAIAMTKQHGTALDIRRIELELYAPNGIHEIWFEGTMISGAIGATAGYQTVSINVNKQTTGATRIDINYYGGNVVIRLRALRFYGVNDGLPGADICNE